jgi:hypothetical protein
VPHHWCGVLHCHSAKVQCVHLYQIIQEHAHNTNCTAGRMYRHTHMCITLCQKCAWISHHCTQSDRPDCRADLHRYNHCPVQANCLPKYCYCCMTP